MGGLSAHVAEQPDRNERAPYLPYCSAGGGASIVRWVRVGMAFAVSSP